MKSVPIIACFVTFTFVTLHASDGPVGYICEVTSPVDGSVWTGTNGDGLVRTGRNGKVLQYGVSSGDLGSDTVYSLFFDTDNTLWILDASNRLSTYSSTNGFAVVRERVSSLSADKSTGAVYYSVADTLFSAKNGKIASILYFPAFEFPVPEVKMIEKTDSRGLDWLFIALSFLLGCAITYIIVKVIGARKKERPEAVKVSPAVIVPTVPPAPKIEPEATPVIVKEEHDAVIEPIPAVEPEIVAETAVKEEKPAVVTSSEPGEFTKLVINLVKGHLSDPDFSVESIADITGMSRIHVNRKLKAEGAPAPSAMLKKERMEKAQELLRSGEYSIAAISQLCGFRTPAYFATAFKEYFGCSPSDFSI